MFVEYEFHKLVEQIKSKCNFVKRLFCVGPVKDGGDEEEIDLTELVGGKIAGYKKPRSVTFGDDLPKTEDGSIDQTAVKYSHQ
ncbi:MAG: hypothetical protein KKD92_12265 [Proteobacteria bacterium]|nr:hypothetical protein [Pseudomonadota bacterium]